MKDFVFSMDAHVVEPKTLFQDLLPSQFRDRALHTVREGKALVMYGDGKVIYKMVIDKGDGDNAALTTHLQRVGGSDPRLRFQDMEMDGIDAELLFPNLGCLAYSLEDPELAMAHVVAYNDWLMQVFGPHPDRFVPCAVLPAINGLVDVTLAEFKRVVAMGYKAVTLPVEPSGFRYNDLAFEPVWQYAAEQRIPICFHMSTGADKIFERGLGGAVINYTQLALNCETLVLFLVAGGVLDRHPDLQVAIVEAGASWIAGLCERMDEAYTAHNFYVRPQLRMLPSEYVKRQIKASFQYDRAAIMMHGFTGHECLCWASDYPHMEGTFPHSRETIAKLFDGLDIPPHVRRAILGGNAAKLFGLEMPQALAA